MLSIKKLYEDVLSYENKSVFGKRCKGIVWVTVCIFKIRKDVEKQLNAQTRLKYYKSAAFMSFKGPKGVTFCFPKSPASN